MIIIPTMTAEDALSATSVASLQMVRKVAKGRDSDHGGHSKRTMRERWADGIHGAMAEVSLAKALNRAWTPGGMDISTGDVGYKLEVRATEYLSGHLLIYHKDKDESVFVLMVGHYPQFRDNPRCILGKEAKQDKFWRADADPPCWWVPQSELQPLEL
jgi:hypothetical protein